MNKEPPRSKASSRQGVGVEVAAMMTDSPARLKTTAAGKHQTQAISRRLDNPAANASP
jgi:hypothetical protein